MPPKVRITKDEIIKTALEQVRTQGEQALNARNIAASLGCSTQPIFSNFATMEALHSATVAAAYELYLDFLKNEADDGRYPRYKAFGMAYIRFAKEQKQLFRLLFMRDRTEEDISFSPDFEEAVQMIMNANGVSRENAILIHMEMWSCVHGIGTMLATSFLELDFELISRMLSDVYQGVRSRHLTEENTNDGN